MRLPFALKLALREARSTARRLGVYMGAITLGVAALVAIDGYRANAVDTVRRDARRLLGADLRLGSNSEMPDSIRTFVDSLGRTGAEIARVTGTLSMAVGPAADGTVGGGNARLAQLRAVEGGFPFYDEWTTEPAGLWPQLRASDDALVEPSLLVMLDAEVGDTLTVGFARFRIAGTVTNLPAEFGFRGAIGPRIFIAAHRLPATGLVQFGSMVRYETFVRMPRGAEVQRFVDAHHDRFRRAQISFDTAEDQGEEIAEALSAMSRFLGLVGLTALLLGGLGVASAVNVFVKEKRATVATLRCLGATQSTAFLAYLVQSVLLGFIGAVLGAILGVLTQAALPFVLGNTIPVRVDFALELPAILIGIGIGIGIATLFALLPLLEVRGITPLQALRHDVEPVQRKDPLRWLAYAALVGIVVALSFWQAPDWRPALGFSAGILVTVLVLRGSAEALIRILRVSFPKRASFVVRQGVANLFRPHNQTAAVTVALGFGVYMLTALWLVQRNVLARFEVDDMSAQANLVAFDIQSDQSARLDSLVRAFGGVPRSEPIVTARISAVNGASVDSILGGQQARNVEPWALRREYRNTYRNELSASEEIIAGAWWDASERAGGDTARISIEEDVARALDVGLGDAITWNVQGRTIDSRITSLRSVDWARLDTNFFVIFEPGTLDDAPQSFVMLARIEDDAQRARLQSAIARSIPNVSLLDLALVQRTVERILGNATLAIRFIGGFAILGGVLVLAGAIAAARYQRLRESVLLRTLGATRMQVRAILVTEYAALGALAGLAGSLLAVAASWALVKFLFELEFSMPLLAPIVAAAATAALAIALGLLNSREALRSTPLAALREATG